MITLNDKQYSTKTSRILMPLWLAEEFTSLCERECEEASYIIMPEDITDIASNIDIDAARIKYKEDGCENAYYMAAIETKLDPRYVRNKIREFYGNTIDADYAKQKEIRKSHAWDTFAEMRKRGEETSIPINE